MDNVFVTFRSRGARVAGRVIVAKATGYPLRTPPSFTWEDLLRRIPISPPGEGQEKEFRL